MAALAGPPPMAAVVQPRAEPYRTDDGTEITGADWLNYMRMFFARYVVWPSEAALDTAVLWAAHTYARESMDNGAELIWKATPRLFVLSKERNSGQERYSTCCCGSARARAGWTPSRPSTGCSTRSWRTGRRS